jgi:hypothetical protein
MCFPARQSRTSPDDRPVRGVGRDPPPPYPRVAVPDDPLDRRSLPGGVFKAALPHASSCALPGASTVPLVQRLARSISRARAALHLMSHGNFCQPRCAPSEHARQYPRPSSTCSVMSVSASPAFSSMNSTSGLISLVPPGPLIASPLAGGRTAVRESSWIPRSPGTSLALLLPASRRTRTAPLRWTRATHSTTSVDSAGCRQRAYPSSDQMIGACSPNAPHLPRLVALSPVLAGPAPTTDHTEQPAGGRAHLSSPLGLDDRSRSGGRLVREPITGDR